MAGSSASGAYGRSGSVNVIVVPRREPERCLGIPLTPTESERRFDDPQPCARLRGGRASCLSGRYLGRVLDVAHAHRRAVAPDGHDRLPEGATLARELPERDLSAPEPARADAE